MLIAHFAFNAVTVRLQRLPS